MPSYSDSDHRDAGRAPMGAGLAFLWVALILNLAWFSAFAVSTASGIFAALSRAQPVTNDVPVHAGGAQWAILEVVGPILLGLVMAYALYRYATRNRRLDRRVTVHSNVTYDVPASERAPETVRY